MRIHSIFLSVLLLAGCAGQSHTVKNTPAVPEPAVSGSVIDIMALKAGGKVGFTPFKAGPGAEENDQLDRVSLMLIKGMGERLAASGTGITITDRLSEANFMVEGYIEEFYQPGRYARVVRKKKPSLSVSGSVWLKTKRKAMTFASSRTIAAKTSPEVQAYQMGLSIGDFIVDTVGKGQP